MKNVPGRKTDVADAVWLSDLLAHGLIRPSFVPDAATQAMRDLLRTRKQLVREQASHVQRIQKTLEDANLKLASVLTDIMGQSGRAVLAALAAGETDPERLLALVGPRVKASPEAIRAALTGRPSPHHRFLLGLHLGQIDALAAAIAEIDAEVERDLGPFREAVALLVTIPGVGDLTAQVVLSEIGLDMSRFPTAGHLISWAGLCPRNDESAGKRRSTRLRKGAPWLKTALVQSAWAAVRKKHGYFNAQFQRLRGRRGARKAICAVAASILTADLPHAERRHRLRRPRTRPLPQERAHDPGQGPRQTDRTPRLHLLTLARGASFYLDLRLRLAPPAQFLGPQVVPPSNLRPCCVEERQATWELRARGAPSGRVRRPPPSRRTTCRTRYSPTTTAPFQTDAQDTLNPVRAATNSSPALGRRLL